MWPTIDLTQNGDTSYCTIRWKVLVSCIPRLMQDICSNSLFVYHEQSGAGEELNERCRWHTLCNDCACHVVMWVKLLLVKMRERWAKQWHVIVIMPTVQSSWSNCMATRNPSSILLCLYGMFLLLAVLSLSHLWLTGFGACDWPTLKAHYGCRGCYHDKCATILWVRAYEFNSPTSSVMFEYPQVPRRSMYARLFGSEAPVADEYKTLAPGTFIWSFRMAFPVWVDCPAKLQTQIA